MHVLLMTVCLATFAGTGLDLQWGSGDENNETDCRVAARREW